MTPTLNTAVLLGDNSEKAVTLARKSQARIEAETETIERQFEDGDYYAARHDPPFEVIAKLYDLETGYKDKGKNARPGLREALRMIEAGEAQHLIVARLDRLTRQGPLVFLTLLQRIKDAGGTLHILDIPGLGSLDASGGIGQGILALLAGVAKEWADRTSTNVKRAELASAAAGKRHGGSRPFGWHQAPRKGEAPCPSCGQMMEQQDVKGRLVAKIELCPVESEIIQEAATRLMQKEPLRSIVADFEKRGIKTATGTKFVVTSLKRTLRSPALSGKRTHLGIEYEGVFPAILTPEDHVLVLARLKTNDANLPKEQSLLTGLDVLFCECGARMRTSHQPGHTADHPSGRTRTMSVRYRCAGYEPGTGGCGRIAAVQSGVDEAVVYRVLNAIKHWQTRNIVKQSQSEYVLMQAELDEDKATLERLIHACYIDKKHPLYNDEEGFRSAYGPLKAKVEDLEGLLTAIRPPVEDEGAMMPKPDESLEDWWKVKEIADQRAIVKYYVRKVVVKKAIKKGRTFDKKRVEVEFFTADDEAA